MTVKNSSVHQLQGCFINLWDGEKKVEYELHSIKYELTDTGVAICTYNTPKNLNALSLNNLWETFAILEHMARDTKVRVAVWTGSGNKSFSVGADLAGDNTQFIPRNIRAKMTSRNMGPVKGDVVLNNLTKAFWDFPKPSICAVNGLAIGAGANIALVNYHDLVLASNNATFFYPFVKHGLAPELASSFMMPRSIGMARAKELMFLGSRFSAQEALRMGLINRITEQEKLLDETMKIAEELARLPMEPLKQTKKLMNGHIRGRLDEILRAEQEAVVAAINATGGPKHIKSKL